MTVTVVPPAIGPVAGVIDVITGINALLVNSMPFDRVAGPPAVTTPMSTTAAEVAGVVNRIFESEITVKETVVVPRFTLDVPSKLAPVKVTIVPPLVVPRVGELVLRVGARTYVIALESV
jgi:hypothetical protein